MDAINSDLEELYTLFEKQQFHEFIYELISEDWSQKRRKAWNDLETELHDEIKNKYSICLDAGSGSGRNILIFLKYAEIIIALDISKHQIDALKKEYIESSSNHKERTNNLIRINVVVGDITQPPFRHNSIDFIASISTVHHIQGKENRISCFNELFKLLPFNGLFVFTVWRFDIPKFKNWYEWQYGLFNSKMEKKIPFLMNKKIEFGDIIVPWTISKYNKTYYRFYHLYTQDSLLGELNGISEPIKKNFKSFPKEKKENFIIFLKKSD